MKRVLTILWISLVFIGTVLFWGTPIAQAVCGVSCEGACVFIGACVTGPTCSGSNAYTLSNSNQDISVTGATICPSNLTEGIMWWSQTSPSEPNPPNSYLDLFLDGVLIEHNPGIVLTWSRTGMSPGSYVLHAVVQNSELFDEDSLSWTVAAPPCNTGVSCSGSCSAPPNTCSVNNGSQGSCEYTTYSGGGSCTPTGAPDQSCTTSNCSPGNTCISDVCTPTAAPIIQNLSATSACSTNQVVLSWDYLSDPTALVYGVWRATAPANPVLFSTQIGTIFRLSQPSTYTDSGLTVGQEYTYHIRTGTATGDTSSSFVPVTITGACTPLCDTGISCFGSCGAPPNTCSVNNGLQGFCVYTTYSSGGSCTQIGAPNQSCTLSNCSAGNTCISDVCTPTAAPINGSCSATHYNCAVGTPAGGVDTGAQWKWNCIGSYGGMPAMCSEAKPPPSAPVLFPTAGSCPSVSLSWPPISGATAYEAYSCQGSGCNPEIAGSNFCTTSGLSCSYPYIFYASGGPARFAVRAHSAGGFGPYSSTVESTAYCPAPPGVSFWADPPGPLMIGDSTNLKWTSTGADYCRAASLPPDTPWSTTDDITSSEAFFALKAPQTAPPGGFSTGSLNAAHRFDIQCQGPLEISSVHNVVVDVIDTPPTILLRAFHVGPGISPSEILPNTPPIPYDSTVQLDYRRIGSDFVNPITSCTASAQPVNSQWTGSIPPPGGIGFRNITNLTGTTKFNIQCSNAFGAGNIASVNVPVSPPPPKPVVTLSPINPTIPYNTQVALSWSSTYTFGFPTTCVFSASWPLANKTATFNPPITIPPAGAVMTGSLTADTTYTLTCSNIGGSDTESTSVIVLPPPDPTLTFSADRCGTANVACTLSPPPNTVLRWSSTDADSCTAGGTGWSGGKSAASLGEFTGNLTQSQRYTLFCTGPTGKVTPTKTIDIVLAGKPPTVIFSADKTSVRRGQGTTLRWEVLGPVDSCTASGAWSGSKSITGGSEPTGALTAPKTYFLECTGSGGTTIPPKTVAVSVTAGTPTIIEIPPPQ